MNQQEERYQKARERVAALRGFYRHLIVYVAVNLGLILIDVITSPEHLWFYWPLMGWGIGLAVNAANVFRGPRVSEWERRKLDEFMQDEDG